MSWNPYVQPDEDSPKRRLLTDGYEEAFRRVIRWHEDVERWQKSREARARLPKIPDSIPRRRWNLSWRAARVARRERRPPAPAVLIFEAMNLLSARDTPTPYNSLRLPRLPSS